MKALVRYIVTGLVCFCMVVAATGALADRVKTHDGDDASFAFDIRSVTHAHGRNDESILKHVLVSYDKWSSRSFSAATATMQFDTDGDTRRPERCLSIERSNGKFRGRFYSSCSDQSHDTLIGRAKVWRTDRRSLSASFAGSILGNESYRWSVYVTAPCGDGGGSAGGPPGECDDRVPNRGWILHR